MSKLQQQIDANGIFFETSNDMFPIQPTTYELMSFLNKYIESSGFKLEMENGIPALYRENKFIKSINLKTVNGGGRYDAKKTNIPYSKQSYIEAIKNHNAESWGIVRNFPQVGEDFKYAICITTNSEMKNSDNFKNALRNKPTTTSSSWFSNNAIKEAMFDNKEIFNEKGETKIIPIESLLSYCEKTYEQFLEEEKLSLQYQINSQGDIVETKDLPFFKTLSNEEILYTLNFFVVGTNLSFHKTDKERYFSLYEGNELKKIIYVAFPNRMLGTKNNKTYFPFDAIGLREYLLNNTELDVWTLYATCDSDISNRKYCIINYTNDELISLPMFRKIKENQSFKNKSQRTSKVYKISSIQKAMFENKIIKEGEIDRFIPSTKLAEFLKYDLAEKIESEENLTGFKKGQKNGKKNEEFLAHKLNTDKNFKISICGENFADAKAELFGSIPVPTIYADNLVPSKTDIKVINTQKDYFNISAKYEDTTKKNNTGYAHSVSVSNFIKTWNILHPRDIVPKQIEEFLYLFINAMDTQYQDIVKRFARSDVEYNLDIPYIKNKDKKCYLLVENIRRYKKELPTIFIEWFSCRIKEIAKICFITGSCTKENHADLLIVSDHIKKKIVYIATMEHLQELFELFDNNDVYFGPLGHSVILPFGRLSNHGNKLYFNFSLNKILKLEKLFQASKEPILAL